MIRSMARGNFASLSTSLIRTRFHYTNASQPQRFLALFSNHVCAMAIRNKKTNNGGDRSLPYNFSTSWNRRTGFAQYSKFQQGSPTPPSGPPPNSSGKRWTAGIIMTVILPLFGHKYTQYLEEVDTVVETAQEIIDVIEVVAEKVDEVAEDIAGDLPEGGKLRNSIDFVEDVAETIAKDAHLAGEFLDKVEDIDEKLEAMVKPVRRHIKEDAKKTSY